MFEHAINVESTLEEIDVKTSDGKFLHHNDIAILDSNFRQLEQWADGKIWNTLLDTKLGQLMLQRYKRLNWLRQEVRERRKNEIKSKSLKPFVEHLAGQACPVRSDPPPEASVAWG
jgi:hypothetical protein